MCLQSFTVVFSVRTDKNKLNSDARGHCVRKMTSKEVRWWNDVGGNSHTRCGRLTASFRSHSTPRPCDDMAVFIFLSLESFSLLFKMKLICTVLYYNRALSPLTLNYLRPWLHNIKLSHRGVDHSPEVNIQDFLNIIYLLFAVVEVICPYRLSR